MYYTMCLLKLGEWLENVLMYFLFSFYIDKATAVVCLY